MWGSFAALAAGAGAAFGQAPMPPAPAGDPPPPAAVAPATTDVIPAAGRQPAPVIMPPLAPGPQGDPLGFGPAGGSGPPPGPMYPNPGPYGAPTWQPAPPGVAGAFRTPVNGYAPHFWAMGEYLMYFPKAQPVRFPLLTTSAPSDLGLLGRPSTLVLVGNNDLGYNTVSGFRATAGFFWDCDRRYGLEASGFLLEQKANTNFFQSAQAGIPVLARPFIDSTNFRAANALVVSAPNLGSGSALVYTSTRSWGLEGSGVINLYRTGPACRTGCSVDFLIGPRFFELDEQLNVSSQTTLGIPPTFTPVLQVNPFGVLTQVGATLTPGSTTLGGVQVFTPASIEVRDSFKTTNQFYGGQVGLRTDWRLGGAYSLLVTGKFAMGEMHETIEVNGGSGFIDPTRGTLGTSVGGLLANAANIGKYHHDEFAIIPEVNASIGVAITRGITGYIGYNFLYVNKVARPGSQINPVVNTASVPFSPNFGTNRPLTTSGLFAQDDFWLMGVNFGLNFRY
jgi:hypothetical protein